MNDDLSELTGAKPVVQASTVTKAVGLGWGILFVIGGLVVWFKYFKK